MLTDLAIKEFNALWKKHYGKQLPIPFATTKALDFYNLIAVLVQQPRLDSKAKKVTQ